MRDGKRANNENRITLSPVTLSSGSDHSKHASVSPPKIIGSFTTSLDGTVRLSPTKTPIQNYPTQLRKPRNMFLTRIYRPRSKSPSQEKSVPSRYRSRSRSRSLPKRYRSRSRSRGRSSRNRRSRSRSRSFRNWRSRSRSQGRRYRNRRSRSRSSGKGGRKRRSRSRSTSFYSKSSSRRLSRSRSRSREHSRRKYRSKSPSLKLSHHGENVDIRSIWETYQAEVSALETMRQEEVKLYDKDPEKHPDYKLEWKKFYKGRVQEIINQGDDPKLHNFESEWAYFWKFRMSELINADYEKKKVALKRRLKLPIDAEMPLYLQIKDVRNADLVGGTTSQTSTLPSSKIIGINKGLISTLRIVTAVEEQLSSLGPRVIGLLSEAVALQRISGSDPDSLLSNPDNFVLLETVKEKLLGQVQSNIVKKSLEAAVEEAIISINVLIQSYTPPDPKLFQSQLCASGEKSLLSQGSTSESQTNVPDIGEVDRVAIAQQIADALVKQGKTDVTEAELQQLVNEVVGMVEAQAAQEQEKQMPSLKEKLPVREPVKAEVVLKIPEEKKSLQVAPVSKLSLGLNSVAPTEIPSIPDPPTLSKNPVPASKESDALSMLMSVVKSGIKKTDPVEKTHSWSSDDSNESITIKSTPASSLLNTNPVEDSKKQGKDKKPNLKLEFNKTTEVVKRIPSSERQGLSIGFTKKESPKWFTKTKKSPSPEIFKSMKKKVLLAAAQSANGRRGVLQNKCLSPFSSREETSNPLPNSEEEDEDLKVIGAWDSDSDIDLDSFGKTKGLAYDKVNVKRLSPGKYEKNMSLLNKSKEVVQNTVVKPPGSVATDINLDAAIDNLMGELKSKTSKIEVISSKPQPIAKKLQNVSATKFVGQANNGQTIRSLAQQTSANKVVATQAYNVPYIYPQPQSYSAVQPGYYSNSSMPDYTQASGVSYYTSNQGATASTYYGNSGNLVYCPTMQSASNAQWQSYYGSQQTNVPSNQSSGTNYGKY